MYKVIVFLFSLQENNRLLYNKQVNYKLNYPPTLDYFANTFSKTKYSE